MEDKARVVLIRMAKKLIRDMLYEARVLCVVKFYAKHMNTKLTKTDARQIHLSAVQYLAVMASFSF